MERLIQIIQGIKKGKRIYVVLFYIALLVGFYFLGLYCVGLIINSIRSFQCVIANVEYIEINPFKVVFETPFGNYFAIIMGVLLVIGFLYILLRLKNRKNYTDETDERGVSYMNNGTYGTSRWMPKEDIEKNFYFGDITNTTTNLYGQYSTGGREVVGYKKREKGGSGSQNTLLLASMGSGKSWSYCRGSLLSCIARKDSFCVTDPSGELYKDLSSFCKKVGMDVHVFNMAEPEYSECWNMLEETINPETERLDPARLNSFASIYMENSTGSGVKDFWYSSAEFLIKALIGYTSYMHENKIIEGYVDLYEAVNHCREDANIRKKAFETKLVSNPVSFKKCREDIMNCAKDNGYDLDVVNQAFSAIKHSADVDFPYTISAVIDNLNKVDSTSVKKMFELIPQWHPAYQAYIIYAANDKEEVKKAAIQGAQQRFASFTDLTLKKVVSNEGIHINQINKKWSAFFIITDDTPEAIKSKAIVSLFFSFLFTDAIKNFDKEARLAVAEKRENRCLPVTYMLDEAFSLGTLCGSPESRAFSTILSDSRKRNLHISIILQNITQLRDLYGDNGANTIISGCDTLLYMGGNDPETCKFISEFVSGETTVLDEQHDEAISILPTERVGTNYRSRAGKRYLLTVAEAKEWTNAVLVSKQGTSPLKLNLLPWTDHPLYSECEETSIYENILPVDERNLIELGDGKRSKEVGEQLSSLITYLRKSKKQAQKTAHNTDTVAIPLDLDSSVLIADEDMDSDDDFVGKAVEIPKNKQKDTKIEVVTKEKEIKNEEDSDETYLDFNDLLK